MRERTAHLSDEELLQAADGELDRRRADGVAGHLSACWSCRARSHALEAGIAAFVESTHRHVEQDIPSADGPRALLRARLAELAMTTRPSGWGRARTWVSAAVRPDRALAARAAVAAVVVLVLGIAPQYWPSRVLRAEPGPDAELTPGSTTHRSRDVACASRAESEPPRVSRAVALSIFRTYGITDPAPHAYELDYLIAPELGGSTDVRNLWPQSYAGRWNAHLKDALEDYLYFLVCDGQVELHVAQQDIAVDWIAAYKKYFKTGRPLTAHETFRKDQPWP